MQHAHRLRRAGDGDLTTAGRRLRAAAAGQRAVGDLVWFVVSVGYLCLIMLEKGTRAEARALRAEVLSAVWLYGMHGEAGGYGAPCCSPERKAGSGRRCGCLAGSRRAASAAHGSAPSVGGTSRWPTDRGSGLAVAAAVMAEGAVMRLDEPPAQALATEDVCYVGVSAANDL